MATDLSKIALPQLRCRTEFSFREVYGPVRRVATVLAELGARAAGIVDPGTWGHVRWSKELARVGVKPIFGTELRIKREDGSRPHAWAIAEDTRQFYRFSTAARREEADIEALFGAAKGVLRFAGTALTDPATFDYIDLNPASALQQRAAIELAKRTKKPLVVTSDNSYPAKADYEAFMSIAARERMTPQHLLRADELYAHLRKFMDEKAFRKAVKNTIEAAERAASVLPTAPLIQVEGDLRALAEEGRQRRLKLGHLSSWPEEYAARLERELVAIEQKAFQSYFLVVADLVNWAKGRMLVGPGRGSSAGSLLCYLIGITEVDPIPHGLLFERFIDLTRKDLPDIDIDFNDVKREQCFEYLAQRYGRQNVARIGNINTLKPKSVLAEVCKRFGIPDHERFALANVIVEHSSGSSLYGHSLEDALQNTEIGQRFMNRHPKAAVLSQVENHAWHSGVHAAGVIVSNERVDDYCTVGPDGVALIDKPDSEALNLLKIDALGLRTLGIIEDSGVVTADELYALKPDDPEVFRMFNEKRYSSIFQFEGQAQRQISANVRVDDFRTIDHLTALARPGPLGGGATNHYIMRKAGKEEVVTRHPSMLEALRDTYGVVLYQEQVMQIVREIGKFSWEDTTVIRKAMSGRKGEEFFNQKGALFIKGAAEDGIDAATAAEIWNEMCSFGAWGMNRAHTCSYAFISYWCAWMKRYHRLEYAAACLRSAKDDDQTLEILREMVAEGTSYTPFDVDRSAVNWAVVNGELIGGFLNLVGIGPAKAAAAINARENGTIDRQKYLAMPVKFADLYPIQMQFRAIYDDPEAHGCSTGSRVLLATQLPEDGDCLYIGKLVEKKLRDQNEAVLVSRREGRMVTGPTAFADFVCKDDTGIPIICRVDRYKFEEIGRGAFEELQPNKDVIMIRGKRVKGFQMIRVARMRCLTRPDALQ